MNEITEQRLHSRPNVSTLRSSVFIRGGLVTTLFQRAENLTSNNDANENECQYVTNILKENNYPKSFLYDCLRRPTLTHCNSPEGDSAVKALQ